ncbi:MAG: tyrosinase family protein [Trinickia sp.]
MANTNASDPNSWQYWANIHFNHCPHMVPYFLAWHRGYIYYFEQRIRMISGDANFTLPYWDWFTNPNVPSEFTDPASGNVLYCPRVNTNVYAALDLTPWSSSIVNFQRGTVNSFEATFEGRPHNPVHNIIGAVMNSMYSPQDPIFYLHHSNMDRLWHAWCLPFGGTMPAPTDPYWSGSFTYASNLTMLKQQTYSPRTRLFYDYADTTRPSSLPPQTRAGRIIRVQASLGFTKSRPPLRSLTPSAARNTETGRSIGGVKSLVLGDASVTAHITAEATSLKPVHDILSATAAPLREAARGNHGLAAMPPAIASTRFRSIKVVFDGLSLTAAGGNGGFFYNVYLNLPDKYDPDSQGSQLYLGTLGGVEIAAAAHHGMVMMDYPATAALLNAATDGSRDYYISLVRVNGPNAPTGAVIQINEVRVELSTEAPYIVSPPSAPDPNNPY